MRQSLGDAEWAAMPGKNTFVYPAPDGSALGFVTFKNISINGKSYGKLRGPARR
jgi:hypothetical protein